MSRRHGHARERAAAFVVDGTSYFGLAGLRGRWECSEKQQEQCGEDVPDAGEITHAALQTVETIRPCNHFVKVPNKRLLTLSRNARQYAAPPQITG